ncbi:hypothetical protein D3C87_2137390 [compost metagenome]
MNHAGDCNAARRGKSLDPRSDVHAFTENIAILSNHIPQVDANAELDGSVL